MTDQIVPGYDARLLSAVDDAVCQYQYETLEARDFMEFIRHLERHGAGLGEVFTDDNEPTFRAIFGLAKSFEDAAAASVNEGAIAAVGVSYDLLRCLTGRLASISKAPHS